MCTIVILNELVKGYPLIVAANRDERYDRASSAPSRVTHGDKSIIKPRDNEKGGTWTGVAQDGWFVGLTNQDDDRHCENRESRGKIVDDCLKAGQHSAAARILANLDATRFNPFNLVFGRPGAMFLSRINQDYTLEMELLEPGINVVSNDCCGMRYKPKVDHAAHLASLIDVRGDIEFIRNQLLHVLADHSTETIRAHSNPFQSLCVHADDDAFGTRSTSIITVSNQGNVEYWYSEGHPCQSTGLTLVGSMLHMDFSDLNPVELIDDDIEVIE